MLGYIKKGERDINHIIHIVDGNASTMVRDIPI